MVAQAVYASVQDNAASLMQPLHEASQILVRNSRQNKHNSSTLNSDQKEKLLASFDKAMQAIEKAEATALYYNQEQLEMRLESLRLAMMMVSTIKNLGEPLVAKARQQRSAYSKQASRVEVVYGLFVKFHKRLDEAIELVNHLVTTPGPEEDSDEFAEFLVSLGHKVA